MKSQQIFKHVAFTLIALLPLLYLFVIWQKLPAEVATHFDIHGQPNDYTDKSSLPALTGVLCGVVLLCYYLLHFLHKIDPKRADKPSGPIMKKIAAVIVIFLTAINFTVLFSSINPHQQLNKLTNPLLGLLFTFLGYYMYSVKPNYFVGIRIPWALASDYNWKKTHQLAGVMWFIGGIMITIASLVLSAEAAEYFLFSTALIMVIVPSVYSFILFKKRNQIAGYFEKES